MKLMKHITIALVLCAIPAMALGQVSVTCDECKHMVPIFMGDGGLVAEAADDAEEVSYLSTCGGVTSWGSEMVVNGMVGISFQDKGLACAGDDGTFSLGPIKDGGWYWITKESNSAVGSLLHEDVYMSLMGTETEPTSAGGVEVTSQNGAALLEHPATGRVGILSTLLPVTPDAPLGNCGYTGAGSTASPFKRVATGCALGDDGSIVLATIANPLTGGLTAIPNMGMIARPTATAPGDITVTVDLWGSMGGHYVTDASASAALGQTGVAMTEHRAANRLTGVTYEVALAGDGRPGSTDTAITAGNPQAGVDLGASPDANTTQIVISGDATFCGTTPHNAVIKVNALMTTATDAAQITPPLKVTVRAADSANIVGSMSFTVTCPAASSSHQGQELVPENPFPTE